MFSAFLVLYFMVWQVSGLAYFYRSTRGSSLQVPAAWDFDDSLHSPSALPLDWEKAPLGENWGASF